MKCVEQLLRASRNIKLSDMIDEEGIKWIKTRYKEIHKEIDGGDRDRKVNKALNTLAIKTATADVFGDVMRVQLATKRAERSLKRTARWAVPHDDLDINVILDEMPDLYRAYRQYQEMETKSWSPGQCDDQTKYKQNWFKESKKAAEKAKREFEREVAYSEMLAAREEKEKNRKDNEERLAALQPSLF
jgi:hypothetical protein